MGVHGLTHSHYHEGRDFKDGWGGGGGRGREDMGNMHVINYQILLTFLLFTLVHMFVFSD